VKATFFLNTEAFNNQEAISTIRNILQEGHECGIEFPLSLDTLNMELKAVVQFIKKAISVLPTDIQHHVKYLRGKNSQINENIFQACKDEGFIITSFTINSMDFTNDRTIILSSYANVLEKFATSNGSFITLHHDESSIDHSSLDIVISYVKSKEYQFVNMTECLSNTPKNPALQTMSNMAGSISLWYLMTLAFALIIARIIH
jgi:peptidoglycan/xylan/chitin deacetylase (PgdA/CDA1 family)